MLLLSSVRRTEEQLNMRALGFTLILFGLQLLQSEGVQVAKIKKGGNVYVNVVVPHSKKMFGLMKMLDKKLDRLIKASGSTAQCSLSCPKSKFICSFDLFGFGHYFIS